MSLDEIQSIESSDEVIKNLRIISTMLMSIAQAIPITKLLALLIDNDPKSDKKLTELLEASPDSREKERITLYLQQLQNNNELRGILQMYFEQYDLEEQPYLFDRAQEDVINNVVFIIEVEEKLYPALVYLERPLRGERLLKIKELNNEDIELLNLFITAGKDWKEKLIKAIRQKITENKTKCLIDSFGSETARQISGVLMNWGFNEKPAFDSAVDYLLASEEERDQLAERAHADEIPLSDYKVNKLNILFGQMDIETYLLITGEDTRDKLRKALVEDHERAKSFIRRLLFEFFDPSDVNEDRTRSFLEERFQNRARKIAAIEYFRANKEERERIESQSEVLTRSDFDDFKRDFLVVESTVCIAAIAARKTCSDDLDKVEHMLHAYESGQSDRTFHLVESLNEALEKQDALIYKLKEEGELEHAIDSFTDHAMSFRYLCIGRKYQFILDEYLLLAASYMDEKDRMLIDLETLSAIASDEELCEKCIDIMQNTTNDSIPHLSIQHENDLLTRATEEIERNFSDRKSKIYAYEWLPIKHGESLEKSLTDVQNAIQEIKDNPEIAKDHPVENPIMTLKFVERLLNDPFGEPLVYIGILGRYIAENEIPGKHIDEYAD